MQIEASIGVIKACEIYFESAALFIMKHLNKEESTPKLEFFRIKSFMNTAFNNLHKLDSAIYYDKELQECRYIVRKGEQIYLEINKHIIHKKFAFEKIFLSVQPEIVEKDSFEKYAKNRIRSLSELGKDLENITNNTKKIDPEKRNIEAKRIQTTYVNTIHERANLNEKLKELAYLKELYASSYYDEFVGKFLPLANKYKDLIKLTLDQKIIDLERILWDKASRSKSINAFFEKAQIKGGYSTKIYLEYYLKTLDPSKMSDEHRELADLYKYLKSIDK